MNTEIELMFDKVLARVVAKIAVNYLAKVHGGELVLRPAFEAVRRFVRYATAVPRTS